MYISCISHQFTEFLDTIYTVYVMYIICIFCVHTNDIPKLNMQILHAGQGRGSLSPQTVSSKHLDEIGGLQFSDIVPEVRAASVVSWTVLGAHHSRVIYIVYTLYIHCIYIVYTD